MTPAEQWRYEWGQLNGSPEPEPGTVLVRRAALEELREGLVTSAEERHRLLEIAQKIERHAGALLPADPMSAVRADSDAQFLRELSQRGATEEEAA